MSTDVMQNKEDMEHKELKEVVKKLDSPWATWGIATIGRPVVVVYLLSHLNLIVKRVKGRNRKQKQDDIQACQGLNKQKKKICKSVVSHFPPQKS